MKKLKSEIIGVIAASALGLTPVFANDPQQQGSRRQGESQQSPASSQSGASAQGGAQQSASAASDPALVSQVQQALTSKGYDVGEPDGKMGEKTKDALTRFQQSQGLQATGQLDAQTLAALGIAGQGVGAGQSGDASSSGSVGSSGSSSDQSGSVGSSGSGDTLDGRSGNSESVSGDK